MSEMSRIATDLTLAGRDPSEDDLRAILAETQEKQREAAVRLAAWVRDNFTDEYGYALGLADAVLEKDRLQRRLRSQIVNGECS